MHMRTMVGISVAMALAAAPAVALHEEQIAGVWRNPMGGTCAEPFFQTAEDSQTVRGEMAVRSTIQNAGLELVGDVVVEGQRRGQFVSPETDRALFLVDLPDGGPNIRVIPMALDYRVWGDIVLEKCP